MNHQELIVLLKDCYETADFSPLLPFLSPEVKRVSMWYDDIVGIDAFIEYLHTKENHSRMNSLSRYSLAKLSYINNQPATYSSIEHNHVHPDSHLGKYKPDENTRFALWYPEDEFVLLAQDSIYADVDVVIRIELNAKGQLICLSLSDAHLYAYTLVDVQQYTDVQLCQMAVDFIDDHYHKLGYETHVVPYEVDIFPHLHVQKQNTQHQVVVLVDRYPFSGGCDEDVARFLAMRSYLSNCVIKLIHVQVESLGLHKHRFGVDDPIQCHILSAQDAYTPYTEKEIA